MSILWEFIYRQYFSHPPIPTTSFKGRTAIVTGSNVGLGLETCRWMVRLGASRVILACRNVEKGKAAAMDIQATTSCPPSTLEVWPLDMSSYASVLAFADRAKSELPRLDALVANAGVSARKFQMTEGNEETITTNVISTALLGLLLHPKLADTAAKYETQTHFTITSSELHQVAAFKESQVPVGQIFATLNDERKSNMADRYNISKLLEVYIVKQMAALSPQESSNVTVNCVGPGFCKTSLTRNHQDSTFRRLGIKLFILLTARESEVGARVLVNAASAGPETHGQYLADYNITETKGLAAGKKGEELQALVWAELRDKLENIHSGVTNLS